MAARSRRSLAAEAWGALLRAHARLVPRLDAALRREHGLSLAFYDVLLELQGVPENRMTMKALGERVVLSRSRVSRVVEDMVRAGLVVRGANPEDGRSAFAGLSPAGREAFRAAAPTYLRLIDLHLGRHLSMQELSDLAGSLNRVLTAADAEDEAVRPLRHVTADPGART